MFIRTKDKILSTKDLINVELEDKRFKNIYRNENYVLYKAIKQADTIEELCDKFYWDCEDSFNIHNFMTYSEAKDTWDEYVNDCLIDEEKPDRNMYGCIKTSKGLIYVAKMNDKGKLELI